LSGSSDSADFYIDGQDHSGWCLEYFIAFPVRRCAHKERSSIWTTQDTSNWDQSVESVFVGGLASGESPEDTSPDWISHPNSPFGVKADPIGWSEWRSVGRRAELRVDTTIREGAVGSTIERGHPGSSAFGDEKDVFVGREHVAVWRFQPVGSDEPPSIGTHRNGLTRLAIPTLVDSASHVADVCGAVRRNDHVVE
jgi:hypothetical protein